MLECPVDPFFRCPAGPRVWRRRRQTVRVTEYGGAAGCGALYTIIRSSSERLHRLRASSSSLHRQRLCGNVIPTSGLRGLVLRCYHLVEFSWLVLCSCVGNFLFSMLQTHQWCGRPSHLLEPPFRLHIASDLKISGVRHFSQIEFHCAATIRNHDSEPETPFWHPAGTGIWRRSSPSSSLTPLHQPSMIPPSMCD
jgi:hypothetical protein